MSEPFQIVGHRGESNRSTLLGIPAEIREQILLIAVGTPTVHILKDKAVACSNTTPDRKCYSVDQCHCHIGDQETSCERCLDVHSIQLLGVCRTIRGEVAKILFDTTLITFPSAELLLRFYKQSACRRYFGRQISLSCGPAKFAQPKEKRKAMQALQLLSARIPELQDVYLGFDAYYGIHDEKFVLCRQLMKGVGRLSGLRHLSLRIDWMPVGPSGLIGSQQESRKLLEEKVARIETAFSELLCQRKGQTLEQKDFPPAALEAQIMSRLSN